MGDIINFALDDQSIIAQCTAHGKGALAIIRVSGLDAVQIASYISKLASGKKLDELPTHTIHYGEVVDRNGLSIDHVLFLLMRAPRSFTGQDTVEITCHNNPFIIESIIEQAIIFGARLAVEGEFTKRAFLNNKIDLLQAEAINEVSSAQTQSGIKLALSQIKGSLSSWVSSIEKDLLNVLSYTQASFEFVDEEIEFKDYIYKQVTAILSKIESAKQIFNRQCYIRNGIRIAIIGAVNVGKSSLFNKLLNQERAIVTPVAGTTRDTIEASIYHNGIYWNIVDTAGIRVTDDVIEIEGINRSYQEAQKADIIMLVFDGSVSLNKHEFDFYLGMLDKFKTKVVLIKTKLDIALPQYPSFSNDKSISISIQNENSIDVLKKELAQRVIKLLSENDVPFLLNKRQLNLIERLEKELLIIEEKLTHKTIAYELIAHHLQNSLENFFELTGKSINEISMDAIFKEFCIGK